MLSITPIASNIIRSFAYDICMSLMRLISKPNKIEIDFSQISSWFVVHTKALLTYLLTYLHNKYTEQWKIACAKIVVIQTRKTLERISKSAHYEKKNRKTN